MSSMKDLKNNVKLVTAIEQQAATGDVTGETIDRTGFEGVTVAFNVEEAAGDFAVKLQDSPNGTVWTDVDASLVLGTQGQQVVEGEWKTLGYVGGEQYVRGFATHTGDGDIVAVGMLSTPNVAKTGAN